MSAYYSHSGKFSPGGLVVGTVAGVLGGAVLGYLYAYVILYIPLAGFITFILSAGYGGLLGGVAVYALKWQKVRNTGLMFAVTALVSLKSLYFAWATWVYAFLRRSEVDADLLSIVLQPWTLWDLILKINEVGAWSIRSMEPKGTFLGILWLIETGIILVVAFLIAAWQIQDEPFCESCNTWCKGEENIAVVAKAEAADVKIHAESKNFAYFEELGAVAPEAMEWLRMDVHICSQCKQTGTLTVKAVTKSIDKEGKASTSDTDIVDKLLVNSSDVYAVRDLGKKFPGGTATDVRA
jgi:hypothetical protein